MIPTAIEILNLFKSYGNVQALKGVSLKVEKGSIFGFLGPNGAGKTTTIRCMLDSIRPHSGNIQVLGFDPQKASVKVRERVGYLPGELNMEGNRKVSETLRYFGGLRNNNLDWGYVEGLASQLDLDLGMSIKNLSKGNKQKVGVVQALMHRPELLILDEPTSGLDPLIQQEVYRLLRTARSAGSGCGSKKQWMRKCCGRCPTFPMLSGNAVMCLPSPWKVRWMDLSKPWQRIRSAISMWNGRRWKRSSWRIIPGMRSRPCMLNISIS